MICPECESTRIYEVLLDEDIYLKCKNCGAIMENEDDW